MKIKLILLLCFSVSFGSCGRSPKGNANRDTFSGTIKKEERQLPYHISLPEKGKTELTSSFFADSILYIPLETNKNSLLRMVSHVKMNDSIIAISDMRKILLFRYDGTFIRRIGRTGKGPGEYGTIGNFILEGDTIYLVSSARRAIIKYTTDGQFQGEHPIKDFSCFFSMSPQGNIALYNEFTGIAHIYDSAFNIKDTLVAESNVSPDRYNFQIFDPQDMFFQISREKLLFTNYMSDTVWNLAGEKKEAEYIFNLKDKLLPWNLQVEYFKGDFNRYMRTVSRYQKINLTEMQDYMFIFQKSWNTDSLNTIYIHNFKDNTTNAFNTRYVNDDLLGNIKLPLKTPQLSTEKFFIAAFSAAELLESMEELNTKAPIDDARHKEWKARMSKIKYDDNPVLVLIKPRGND